MKYELKLNQSNATAYRDLVADLTKKHNGMVSITFNVSGKNIIDYFFCETFSSRPAFFSKPSGFDWYQLIAQIEQMAQVINFGTIQISFNMVNNMPDVSSMIVSYTKRQKYTTKSLTNAEKLV